MTANMLAKARGAVTPSPSLARVTTPVNQAEDGRLQNSLAFALRGSIASQSRRPAIQTRLQLSFCIPQL